MEKKWTNYLLLSRLDTMDERYQLAMLENCLGITALKVYNNLTFADGEVKSVQICMNKLEQQIVGQINETYERYMFNSRDQNNESIDMYINDLRKKLQLLRVSARFAVARQVGNGNQRQKHKEETVTDHKSNFAADCRHLQGGGSN